MLIYKKLKNNLTPKITSSKPTTIEEYSLILSKMYSRNGSIKSYERRYLNCIDVSVDARQTLVYVLVFGAVASYGATAILQQAILQNHGDIINVEMLCGAQN